MHLDTIADWNLDKKHKKLSIKLKKKTEVLLTIFLFVCVNLTLLQENAKGVKNVSYTGIKGKELNTMS